MRLPDTFSKISHPRLRQLLAHWDALRGAQAMPASARIDPVALWGWLGNLILVEATEAGDFRYRVYGTGLAEYFGRDLTGKTTAALRPDVRELVRREYEEVLRTACPLLVTHTRSVHRHAMVFEKLILPFADDSGHVSRLLAGTYPAA